MAVGVWGLYGEGQYSDALHVSRNSDGRLKLCRSSIDASQDCGQNGSANDKKKVFFCALARVQSLVDDGNAPRRNGRDFPKPEPRREIRNRH